jgi:uncharacterized membrane protein YfcA
MIWAVAAGGVAGLVLGFIGAGGTVVGLPVLLYLAALRPHAAMGTNAAGVAVIAAALLLWRARHGGVPWREALTFTAPGVAGDIVGGRIGLVFPGQRLVFLLGILLFAVAGWLVVLSFQKAGPPAPGSPSGQGSRPWLLMLAGTLVGAVAGFFAIGGGFMIVPALALLGRLELVEAAAAGLLPIGVFAAAVSAQYFLAGDVSVGLAAAMLPPGVVAGALGAELARRMPRRALQRVFAVVLVAVGIYMSVR